ncbi:tyrosine-protein kinase receptor TYRO3 isoform X2 [Dunckerocampus dactyliophorus]|uniref:tyrosine-protein kinase receptor TYRO3 isoform X2 n=1 Tax=Dunckerocampus dactyliophorus TaxID=161453 RepID=UPI002405CFF2|nr:tyrosine-protein kinase receptor TYRO3 isoform X2 [Dunckerocampus dactyliophorus]
MSRIISLLWLKYSTNKHSSYFEGVGCHIRCGVCARRLTSSSPISAKHWRLVSKFVWRTSELLCVCVFFAAEKPKLDRSWRARVYASAGCLQSALCSTRRALTRLKEQTTADMLGELLLLVLLSSDGMCASGVTFIKHPINQTASQGNAVRLGCAVEGLMEPDIIWMKDGRKLLTTDQMFIMLGEKHWETFHSVKSVQQQDAGQYWCEVDFHGLTLSSQRAWITVEGVPHFIQEPQDVATLPGTPFNLTCGAIGPPEPVEVLWWLAGVQEGNARPSPSVLLVPGVNSTVKFYCEARNARGISVSRTGTIYIKELPSAPVGLKVTVMAANDVMLSWQPGFTGHSNLYTCVIQLLLLSPGRRELPDEEVVVPPHQHVLSGLNSHSNYSVRISCLNELGGSPFSPWTHFLTPESVPSTAPRNLTFDLSEKQLSLRWAELDEEELQGKLLAYKVQWTLGGEHQEPLLFKETWAHLSGAGRFFNASVQVSACTVVGCGPWSPPVVVLPTAGVHVQRNHIWVCVLFGLLALTVLALLFSICVRQRGKETHFGWVFQPDSANSSVSFTAARSFSRNGGDLQQSTLDTLCISEDLKNKLKDVLIPERLLVLGHMLGKGEFGSVREAFLRTDDSLVQKVAVKVLKSDITSSGDIEQCLKEAAYMKDFQHPNVIQLIGVSLHQRPGQRLPIPMVVLPFMKHGDLHTFLLLSRLGEQPFVIVLTLLRLTFTVTLTASHSLTFTVSYRHLITLIASSLSHLHCHLDYMFKLTFIVTPSTYHPLGMSRSDLQDRYRLPIRCICEDQIITASAMRSGRSGCRITSVTLSNTPTWTCPRMFWSSSCWTCLVGWST